MKFRNYEISKNTLATGIAVFFHLIGLLGILASSNKSFFIAATPYNLLLSLLLIIWTQKNKNYFFYGFLLLAVSLGIIAEIVGVNTGILFGDYSYGSVLGLKIKQVPVIIGVNWFILIYCCGIGIHTLLMKAIAKIAEQSGKPPLTLKALSVIIDGATIAVFFDWVMEPVAVDLGFWKWDTGEIPFYNYLCWFIVSLILLTLFHFSKFNKQNKFAINLLLIQFMFFLLLRTLL